MIASTEVPRGDDTPVFNALVMRGGAVVMRMIRGQAPAANFPQGAVAFVVVWGFFVALQAVGEWSRGSRALTLLARKKTKMFLFDSATFKAVASFSWRPFFWLVGWSLSSMNAGYEGGRRGRGAFSHQMVLNPSPSPSMH